MQGFVGKIASLDNLPNATLCERDSLIAALHPESANAHMWDETPAADLDDDHQEESDDEDFLEEVPFLCLVIDHVTAMFQQCLLCAAAGKVKLALTFNM